MRVAVVALSAMVVSLAFAGAADAALVPNLRAGERVSGLRGIVKQEPTTPVCQDDPCEEPARGLILQFMRAGKVIAEAKTTQAGRYVVYLAAGSYAVRTRKRSVGSLLTPRIVRVPQGHIARVDFHLDTGIQ
jgi:hypothetical protein